MLDWKASMRQRRRVLVVSQPSLEGRECSHQVMFPMISFTCLGPFDVSILLFCPTVRVDHYRRIRAL
jgi:hypothetical protein